MAKDNTGAKPPKAKPGESRHDVAKAVREIVAKSPAPLTLKQIHARHQAAHAEAATTGAVEDSVLTLVKENKLKLARATEKTVTLSREEVERLVAARPAGEAMTFNALAFGTMIDDNDAEVAVKQLLCLYRPKPFSSDEVMKEFGRLGKTRFDQGAVDGALESLYRQQKLVLVPKNKPSDPQRFACA